MAKNFLRPGSKVEVCTDKHGFQGAWFAAMVVSRKRRRATATLRFDHRFDHAGAPLVEETKLQFIRPLPPDDDDDEAAAALEPNDVVDAFYRHAWRTGFVARPAADRYAVAFKDPLDVVVFPRAEVRAHWDWVGSNWVKPRKEVPMGLLFSLASEVEMDIDKGNSGITWFPMVSLGEVGVNRFMLKCESLDNDDKNELDGREIVSAKRIRPRPPQTGDKSFKLSEKVDVFFGSCWTVGIVTRILEGQKFTVTFKHVKKEADFDHTELRPHLDWIDGKWVTNSKGVLFTSDCQEQSMPLGCVKIITLDGLRDKKELSPLSEGPTMERPKLRVYVRRRKPKPTTTQMHQSTEPVVDSSNVELTDMPNFPFVKTREIWEVVESMEVFKNLSKKPHFKPLLNRKVWDLEGIAVGCMVTYSSLTEKIHKLHENDSREYIDNLLKILAEFEALGFDVKVFQDRLNEMQTVKGEWENLRERSKEVESKIKEHTDKVTKANGEVSKIDAEIEKLNQKRAVWISEITENQSEIIKLASEKAVVNASLSCTLESLRSLFTSRGD